MEYYLVYDNFRKIWDVCKRGNDMEGILPQKVMHITESAMSEFLQGIVRLH